VDIEIVDDRLVRIGGSGIYKHKENEVLISDGYLYSQVINTGNYIKVLDIANNEICSSCTRMSRCIDKMIIAVPIKYNGRTIGVIGAISIDKEKKKEVRNKIKSYLEFIHHISDLISIKVKEHENSKNIDKEMEMLRDIIDNIEKGVIILDASRKISYINNIAKKRLNIFEDAIGKLVEIRSIEQNKGKNEMLSFSIDDKVYKTSYKIIPVHPYINNYDKLIIFDEVKENRVQKINTKWEVKKIDSIIGNSEAMKQVKIRTKRVAQSNSTVLITGESGTGKELIAKSIHAEGNRCSKPFIAINCAAIPESLLESELFGYAKGAFSGASNEGKIGKFELANTGVIFLDEIGDLSVHLQAKLLRVLQERKLARIGSNKIIDLDIRVIAATNQNILELVNTGKFRGDLYYRLNVMPINLPPLRERKEDVKAIFMNLLNKYSIKFDISVKKIEESVINKLINYYWPGNIRELENVVEYMMNIIGEDGIISENMLPIDIINYYDKNINKKNNNQIKDVNNGKKSTNDIGILSINNCEDILTIKELELFYINNILDKYGRDTKTKKKIAKKLGIGVSTLYRKLEEN
jgi:transcriptional regulator with PAS, ATPase and Fis domain